MYASITVLHNIERLRMRTAERQTFRAIVGDNGHPLERIRHIVTWSDIIPHTSGSQVVPKWFPHPKISGSSRWEHTGCQPMVPTPLKGGEPLGGSCGARLSRAQNGHLSISPSKKNHAHRTLHAEPLANYWLGWTEMTASGLRGLNLSDFHPLGGGTFAQGSVRPSDRNLVTRLQRGSTSTKTHSINAINTISHMTPTGPQIAHHKHAHKTPIKEQK